MLLTLSKWDQCPNFNDSMSQLNIVLCLLSDNLEQSTY